MSGTLRLVRIHQWPKNGLVLVPLLTSLQLGNVSMLFTGLLAFLAFSLVCSSGYILNDWFDRNHDRAHPIKKNRPLASGQVSITVAIILGILLLFAGLVLSWLISLECFFLLLAYYGIQILYTVYLKKIVFLDVIILAGFYLSRVWFGGLAIGTGVSFWLEAFAVLTFLSLALQKRLIDIIRLRKSSNNALAGRNYRVKDYDWILPMGVASAFASLLMLLLYVTSPEAEILYSNPSWLFGGAIVFLYWMGRLWGQSHREEIDQDAFTFALTDVPTYGIGLLGCCFVWLAV